MCPSCEFFMETKENVVRYLPLNNGLSMPAVGFGTWSLKGETCVRSGIPREELFVETKLYPSQYGDPDGAIEEALEQLGLEYVDMMVLHHPGTGDAAAYRAIERAIERAVERGENR